MILNLLMNGINVAGMNPKPHKLHQINTSLQKDSQHHD